MNKVVELTSRELERVDWTKTNTACMCILNIVRQLSTTDSISKLVLSRKLTVDGCLKYIARNTGRYMSATDVIILAYRYYTKYEYNQLTLFDEVINDTIKIQQ